MNIKCPHCGTEYEVEKKDMYRYTKCEVCGKGFVVGSETSMLSSKNGITRNYFRLVRQKEEDSRSDIRKDQRNMPTK